VIGFALFALTVPAAVHCLIAYGVQLTSPRVAVHSIAGCFFYGAFAAARYVSLLDVSLLDVSLLGGS
jgi:hypothetical protein